MHEYILFMHDDAPAGDRGPEAWGAYIARLKQAGAFQGGSEIGGGVCVSRSSSVRAVTSHLVGFIRIEAESLAAARELVDGNPIYEAGGTVEIRELPRS